MTDEPIRNSRAPQVGDHIAVRLRRLDGEQEVISYTVPEGGLPSELELNGHRYWHTGGSGIDMTYSYNEIPDGPRPAS